MSTPSFPTTSPTAGVAARLSELRRAPLWAGATVFLVAYLAVGPVGSALSDRSAPLPDDPAAEVAAYVLANPGATIAVALLQTVSVLGFAAFVHAAMPVVRGASGPAAGRLRAAGMVSVAAMLVSSALGVVIAAIAPSVAAETVGTLRMANFYAGGVANVATLGLFVYGAARVLGHAGVLGRPAKWFGYVAGTLAMLSVLSLAFYYANAFLPIGRVLSMVWTVVAAVVMVRRSRVAG